jgi:5'(3')-deoxyribonucleotidase
MEQKEIVLIDMDDTSFGFCDHPVFHGINVNDQNCTAMYEPGFFASLKPVPGALQAVRQLLRMGFDVQFATQPVAESPHSYSEKIQAIGLWFPDLIQKVNMTQNKGLLKADYLVDDRADKWQEKFEANGGKFIHFKYAPAWKDPAANKAEWERIVKFFAKERLRIEMAKLGAAVGGSGGESK